MKRKKALLIIYNRLSPKLRFFLGIPITDYIFSFHKVVLFFSVLKHTMLSYPKLSKLYDLSELTKKEGINGGLCECGVWNGGSAGVMAATLKSTSRQIWLFDSFEGMPQPGQFDVSNFDHAKKGMYLGSEEKVRELFNKLKIENSKIHIIKGQFEETIPKHIEEVGQIALLHIDSDYYASVKFCLERLYEKVARGGFIVVDDYRYWDGCTKAVDDFISDKNIKLFNLSYTGVYFRK